MNFKTKLSDQIENCNVKKKFEIYFKKIPQKMYKSQESLILRVIRQHL